MSRVVDLSQALGKMTVDTHRRIRSADNRAKYYKMAERWHQFQNTITGTIGLVPVEVTVKILFDIVLLYEYGYKRDSQLLEPQTHFGFTSVTAPPGSVFYAHVVKWEQDKDFNYIGADVVVGVHNPAIAATGTSDITSVKFTATLHSSFQGYGVPIDNDDLGTSTGGGPSVAPLSTDTSASANEGSTSGTAPTASTGGSTSTGGGGGVTSTGPTPLQLVTAAAPADYPSGPLGDSFTQIAYWSGGSLGDWSIPEYEADLTVPDSGVDSGILTALNPVRFSPFDTASNQTFPIDKYAANYTPPGKLKAGHKARIHFQVNTAPELGDAELISVTLGMTSRQTGLAFFFGGSEIGWLTDLRLLGFGTQPAGGYVGYQDYPYWTGPSGNIPRISAQKSEYELIDQFQNGASDVWVEMWRVAGSNMIQTAIYAGNPDSSTPLYMSEHDGTATTQGPGGYPVSGAYGQEADCYFGWTRAYMSPAADFQSSPRQPQGVASITIYQEN